MTQTKANFVIFAAGIGERMGHQRPKFLVDVAGRTLAEHQLNQLSTLDGCIHIVCGFRADLVCQTVCRFIDRTAEFRPQVSFVYNPQFRQSQVTSIQCALTSIPLERPTFLIDGDVLFRRKTIDQLSQHKGTQVVLRTEVSSDAVIAETHGNQLRSLTRHAAGTLEWANIAKYDPADILLLSELSRDHSVPHHFELINQLIQSGRLVNIHEAEVAEIDQPTDLPAAIDFANRLRLP